MTEIIIKTPIFCDNDDGLENIIAQLQSHTDKILCVINHQKIKVFTGQDIPPSNLQFDYKQNFKHGIWYFFRHIITQDLYCVFNSNAAKWLYPKIIKTEIPHRKPIIKRISNNNRKVTIIDQGQNYFFPDVSLNNIVETKTKNDL